MGNLYDDLRTGKITPDEVLTHEKHISEVNPDSFKVKVTPSGFPSLDDFQFLKQSRAELLVIGGRPSMGKSAFMFQVAYNVAQQAIPVHIFSLEMDKESIVSRLVAGRLNRSLTHIQAGTVPEKDIQRAHAEISEFPYFIDDRGGLSIDDIYDAATQTAIKRNTGLIVIDYLQLVKGRQNGTRDQQVTEMTGILKQLAKELKIPVLVGAQLNRNCEARGASSGNYEPLLSDLRESGGIEQDADIVGFVHRESRYTGNRVGEADIIISKNRNGATGKITMDFTEQQTRFIDRKKYEPV